MHFFVAPVLRRLLLGLALPALALAQSVNLSVDATQTVRTVDERVFGANSVIWDAKAGSDQTIAMIQNAGIRAIRLPGGSLSDDYHWRINKSLANTWRWSASFGDYPATDPTGGPTGRGFINLITATNTQPVVTVNYGSGTPEEAAGLVAYLNASVGSSVTIGGMDGTGYAMQDSGYWAALRAAGQLASDDGMNFLRISRPSPVGARYFEIGNECYGTWETDQQTVAHDPTTYANRVQQYITKMKAVDSTIKVGVVVVTTGENNSYKNWTPVMLARLKTLNVTPDFVIYHHYPQGPGSESDAALLQDAGTWANTAANLRQQLTAYLGAAGAGVEIVVTENNSVYSQPGKQSTSLVNGLYLADTVASVMKTEINGLMWWDIRNGPPTINNGAALDPIMNLSASLYGWRQFGDYGMISTPSTLTGETTYYSPYPTYYVMKLLKYFARNGDTVVKATSSSNLLSIFAARGNQADHKLTLLVINKDPANTLAANIALTGHNPATSATVYSYGKPQDDAAKPGGSGATDIATTTLAISGANFTASFAPYSITVLSLNDDSLAPAITMQPLSQTVAAGGFVVFTAVASGVPAPTYQWRKNGVNIPGATSNSYSIATPVISDAGTYTMVAANSLGSVTSIPATLIVNGPPEIAIVPANQTAGAGYPVTLSVVASASPLTTYQWQNTGVNIAGATNATYFIAKIGAGDAGTYYVVVTNSYGSLTSLGTALVAGSSVTFSVPAGGIPGPTYQWKKGGVDISGATDATYIIGNAGADDADTYTVVVTNSYGSVTSAGAVLTLRFTTPADKRPTGGQRYLWFMNGTVKSGELALSTISTEWQIAGVGDFNSDGKPDILWQNTNTGGQVVWLMNGSTLISVVQLPDLDTEWQMAGAADFNGDGKADILWQNTNTGERYLWLMNGTTLSSGLSLGTLGLEWRIAGTGDFNSDGKPDILWQNVNTGERKVWLMNGTVKSSEVSLGVISTEWQIAGAADFNADGKADIIWQNITTGERVVWLMNGTVQAAGVSITTVSPEWQIAGVADFNGDGKPDILWQANLAPVPFKDFNGDSKADILWENTTTGERKVWLMNAIVLSSEVSLGVLDPTWKIAGSGDFNGDGQADIVLQNTVTGDRKVRLMNGTTLVTEVSLGNVGLDWQMDCVADLDGDGKSDIIWHNTSSGERYAWLMNGTQLVLGAGLGTVTLEWQIVGTGDFNGDGKTDILWQSNITGERYVWLMRGAHQESGVSLGIVSLEWQIAGTGDYNNDGKVDILWQNTTTGERLIWIMNGTQLTLGVGLGTISTDWKIAP